MKRTHRLGLTCITMLGLTAGTLGQGLAVGVANRHADEGFHREVNTALGLYGSDLISVVGTVIPGEALRFVIPIDTRPVLVELRPHSILADGFRLIEDAGDGRLADVKPSPIRTLRGTVPGVVGSVVAGSVLDDGLHMSIRLSDDEVLWLEPLGARIAGAKARDYVLYRGDDVMPSPGTCGSTDKHIVDIAGPGFSGPTREGSGFCTAELACDADFEYFQDYGTSGAVQSRISSVINTMNLQYESDVGITHSITSIVVRTSSSDPYSSSDASTLLNQFRNHWNANHGSIQRDVAQLFTGKEIIGGTIGIAWIGAVCTDFGYGVVQSDFNSAFACATDLSAHELGHNWGADHCGCVRPQAYTMNASITCANRFHPRRTVPEVVSFRDSRGCLDTCGGGSGCATELRLTSHSCFDPNRGNKCLQIDVGVADDCNGALEGATVEIRLTGNTGDVLTGSATTDADGTVSFTLRCNQAASTSYTSEVTSISSGGLPWDPNDPDNTASATINTCTFN